MAHMFRFIFSKDWIVFMVVPKSASTYFSAFAAVALIGICWRQFVSMLAVCFFGPATRGDATNTAQGILTVRDRLHMTWVNTTPVPAKMVRLKSPCYRPEREFKRKTVRSHLSVKSLESSISIVGSGGHPHPARTEIWTMLGYRSALLYLAPESFQYLRIKNGKGSLFNQVHVIAASNGRPTLPILPQLGAA